MPEKCVPCHGTGWIMKIGKDGKVINGTCTRCQGSGNA